MIEEFRALQRRLGPALDANRQGSGIDHVLIALPSYSVSESLLSHYGDRIPSLEQETCELMYISTRRPGQAVIDYYLSLLPPDRRESVQGRVPCTCSPVLRSTGASG